MDIRIHQLRPQRLFSYSRCSDSFRFCSARLHRLRKNVFLLSF